MFNPQKRLDEVRALLAEARQHPPQKGISKMGKGPAFVRHNLAHEAVVLLIGPLRYTEHNGVLTAEERQEYGALLKEAQELRGY